MPDSPRAHESKRPVFIVSTEGKSRAQMKADAQDALRRFQFATPRRRPGGGGV